MSKKEFWTRKIVLECPEPECNKKYKSYPSMMAHFSKDHGAITHKQRIVLFEKAVDNWAEKCKSEQRETTEK